MRALYKPYEDKMHKVTQVIMGMQSDGTLTPQRLDSLRQIYEPINADMKKVKEDYIRQHPDEDISVYLISDFGKTASDLLDLIVTCSTSSAKRHRTARWLPSTRP